MVATCCAVSMTRQLQPLLPSSVSRSSSGTKTTTSALCAFQCVIGILSPLSPLGSSGRCAGYQFVSMPDRHSFPFGQLCADSVLGRRRDSAIALSDIGISIVCHKFLLPRSMGLAPPRTSISALPYHGGGAARHTMCRSNLKSGEVRPSILTPPRHPPHRGYIRRLSPTSM